MRDVPTLYAWAGGGDALRRLGAAPRPRGRLVFGGPDRYTRELGGYERMPAHHRELAVTGAQRHRFVATMSLAADDVAEHARVPRWG